MFVPGICLVFRRRYYGQVETCFLVPFYCVILFAVFVLVLMLVFTFAFTRATRGTTSITTPR